MVIAVIMFLTGALNFGLYIREGNAVYLFLFFLWFVIGSLRLASEKYENNEHS